jgi:hypothetical protein
VTLLVPCLACTRAYLRDHRAKAGYCPDCRRPETLRKLRVRSRARYVERAKPRNTHCGACGKPLPEGSRRDAKWCPRPAKCVEAGRSPVSTARKNLSKSKRVALRGKPVPVEYIQLPVRGGDGKWRRG